MMNDYISFLEYNLHELRIIQKIWYDKDNSYLSSIDNLVNLTERKLEDLKKELEK